ncbi:MULTISPECIES: ParB/RepB/Spo0J family partition protein [Methylobacterium]|uniref:ParB/RepB/Spo0J family partition protein n=1 Tax=Methylobacterium TaxID=407 RepID=UPI00272E0430|nr:ParB/RepB/Spo0J family partition protein [Methylobacterium sp.]
MQQVPAVQIALSSLRPGHHPDAPAGVVNVRKTGRDAGLEALAASIDALGLIQPLVVVPGGDGFHYVVDGNRRHAALESLVVAGKLAPNSEVPVTARDVETAREAGLAANVNQSPMHEADQVEAYAELRRAGLKEKEISARFGQPVAQVRKLLALGGVSPAVLDAWRAGKISVESVRTFTLAPSHADQDRVLGSVLKDGSAWKIKERLGLDGHVAHMLSYVGAKAYRAAGGTVVEDLFGGSDVVSDRALLQRLVDERLDAECERRAKEGWGWVAKGSDLDPGWRWSWPRLKDGQRAFSVEEQARYDELQAYLDADDDDATDEAIAAAHAEVAAIEAAARIPLGAEDRARSGFVVTLGYDGKVAVEPYVVRPEDAPAKPEPAAPTAPAEPEGSGLPNALVERLCDTATAAVQATLGSSPTAGLVALLAGALTADAYAAPMKLRLEGVGGAQAALRDKEAFASLVARLAAMSVDELLVVAAGVAARGVQTLYREHGSKPRAPSERPSVQALMGLPDPSVLQAELRERFDGEAFFKSAPKAVAVAIVGEVLGEAEGRRAAGMKKGDLVAYAVASVLPTGWLPVELRHPGYDGPGSARPAEQPLAAAA